MVNKRIQRIVLMQIRCGLDVRLLRGSLRWSLTDCAGSSRPAWRLQRDELVARIATALIPFRVYANLVSDWEDNGRINLVLSGKTRYGKRWREVWEWPENI